MLKATQQVVQVAVPSLPGKVSKQCSWVAALWLAGLALCSLFSKADSSTFLPVGIQYIFPFFVLFQGTREFLSPSVVHDAEIQSPAGEGNLSFAGFCFCLVNRETLRGHLCRSGTSLGPGLGVICYLCRSGTSLVWESPRAGRCNKDQQCPVN